MKRSLTVPREALRRLLFQRCFYLFVTLLALVAIAPFIEASSRGSILTSAINTFIIVAAVAAVGRTTLSFFVVLCLAGPAVLFRWLSIEDGQSVYLDLSLRFGAAMYAVSIMLLLRYVFDREIMNADRLWGAAATYLMIGVLWTYLFAIIDRAHVGGFAVRGEIVPLQFMDVLYYSFSMLTTTGLGDIVPVTRIARTTSMMEGIASQLFLAILIAKLVGVYPPREREATSH
jgi:hypothetical protein